METSPLNLSLRVLFKLRPFDDDEVHDFREEKAEGIARVCAQRLSSPLGGGASSGTPLRSTMVCPNDNGEELLGTVCRLGMCRRTYNNRYTFWYVPWQCTCFGTLTPCDALPKRMSLIN